MIVILLIFSVVLIEAITQLLTKSVFFGFLRRFFDRLENSFFVFSFMSNNLKCPYCASVLVSFFVCFFVYFVYDPTIVINRFVDYFFVSVFVHRLSNYLHDVKDMYFDKIYRELK